MNMCISYLVVRLLIFVCRYEVDLKIIDDYFIDYNFEFWLLDMGY